MIKPSTTVKLLTYPTLSAGVTCLFFAGVSQLGFSDSTGGVFAGTGAAITTVALLVLWATRKTDLSSTTFKESMLYATAAWAVTGILTALPIMGITGVSFTDAVFEAMSALTTTGATILTGLDALPPTFLLYRQFLQWMGGLGIVIFVVAVLPQLNAGGMRLMRSETPGPVKNDKLAPRMATTTRYLWIVYLSITALCGLAYWLAGMTAFDALGHALTTVSTGGFSTHDASMWYYESRTLLWVSNVFMIAGAVNFALHFRVAAEGQVRWYWRDEEFRWFIVIMGLSAVAVSGYLYAKGVYGSVTDTLTFGTFHVISFMTSTGYGAAAYTDWPLTIVFALMVVAFLGGCSGSTAGGNKIIRTVLAVRVIQRQLKLLLHPRALVNIKYQGKSVAADVLSASMAFFFLVTLTTVALTIVMMATGMDFFSAFSAVVACVNVLGPGFGAVGPNFQAVNDPGSWVLVIAMLLGRLEYFTVFTLFTPAFWRY